MSPKLTRKLSKFSEDGSKISEDVPRTYEDVPKTSEDYSIEGYLLCVLIHLITRFLRNKWLRKTQNRKQNNRNRQCKANMQYRKIPVISPGLYNFVRGFGWAYKRRGLYPGGLITGIKKALRNKPRQC